MFGQAKLAHASFQLNLTSTGPSYPKLRVLSALLREILLSPSLLIQRFSSQGSPSVLAVEVQAIFLALPVTLPPTVLSPQEPARPHTHRHTNNVSHQTC